MARRARIPNPLAEIARPRANRYTKSAGERKEAEREKAQRRVYASTSSNSKSKK